EDYACPQQGKKTMSFYLKLREHSIIRIVLVAALFAAPLSTFAETAQGSPDEHTSPEVASSQFSDPILTVTPQIGYYENAVLRVSGPNGYFLTEYFEDIALISVDLLAEREPLEDGREYSSRSSRMEERLPPGYYNYEVVFYDGSGRQQVHSG